MSEALAKKVPLPEVPLAAVPAQAHSKRKTVHEVIASDAFRALVRKRWTLNVTLLAALFVTYYGFILLIAWDRPLITSKIGAYTTLGIPLGVGVIVVAWIWTAIYVVVSNTKHDPEVERLRKELEH
ncbi:MAG: DUF485 domain-containing protein [Myxococcales bacterium]|jgi:uncharacterized membrane protein (DUF485 family)